MAMTRGEDFIHRMKVIDELVAKGLPFSQSMLEGLDPADWLLVYGACSRFAKELEVINDNQDRNLGKKK